MTPLFEQIFATPEALHLIDFPMIEEIIEIGDLHIYTESIVACDPLFYYYEDRAFTQKVPNGSFPVKLYCTDDEEWGFRNCYAVLRFSDASVKTWKMALVAEQNPAELEKDEFFGYEVEAGMGCFKDERASILYTQKIENLYQKHGQNFNHYDDYIEPEMTKQNEYNYLSLLPDASQPSNIIMFSTGVGDGYYPSYFGFDEAGKIACLLTDFMIIPDEES